MKKAAKAQEVGKIDKTAKDDEGTIDEKIQKVFDKVKNYSRLYHFLLAKYENPALSWTQCAIKAKYSPKTVGAIASDNLQKPIVQEFIKLLSEKTLAKSEFTHNDAIMILGQIARGGRNMEKIAAIKQICDIHGWNSPQKIDHIGGVFSVVTHMPMPDPLPKDSTGKP